MTLFAEAQVEAWLAAAGMVATFLVTAAGSYLLIRRHLRQNRREQAKADADEGEREINTQVRHWQKVCRDLEARLARERAECDSERAADQREIADLRTAERKQFAENIRLTELVRILKEQVEELKRGLKAHGVEVKSTEHRPLPPAEEDGDA